MNAAAQQTPEPDLASRLTEGQANTWYTLGYQLSQQGEHEKASTLFALLGLYRPLEPKYAYAAGVCYRKMGNHEHAIRLFARAMQLQPDDFGPAFHIIECLMLLGRKEQALELLATIAGAARQMGQEPAAERATAVAELIEQGTS